MRIFSCQFCNRETSNPGANAAHERCCNSNPNRIQGGRKPGYKGTNQFLKADRQGLPRPKYEYGDLRGVAVASTKQKSEWAKQAGTGGYKPNAGRSQKYRVTDSFGKEVVLQSSYEMICAELLNEIGIEWTRPGHIKYDDRKYFPDFYLPRYNIYLDPKNDYKAKLDEEKIQKVVDQNDVKVYVLTKEQLTIEYLTMLVSPNGEGLS